jgi:formiminotetrahydrofolate cyclodeaminase
MGAALVGMVVELTRGRPEAAEHAADLEDIGNEASRLRSELLRLTDLDADAYDAVVTARRLLKDTDEERALRAARIVEATREATLAPLSIGRAAHAVLALAERVVPIANRNAISDVGVAALLAVAAIEGAALNVRINLPYLPEDDPLRSDAGRVVGEITSGLAGRAESLRRLVEDRMG